MLEISYNKLIPYPFEVTLSQYFDYEHIAHVHPATVGEYLVVEKNGNVIVYDQIWPANRLGKRAVSRIRHTFEPPAAMWFEFISGRYRGIRVHTNLEDRGESTLVHERYYLPLPNWGWLRPLVRPAMMRAIERIWDEDLRVEVCIGGLLSIPGRAKQPRHNTAEAAEQPGRYVVGRAGRYSPGEVVRYTAGTEEIAVVVLEDAYFAVGGRCPHTGGPLALGKVEGEAIVCPWHGARFCLESGRSLCDVTSGRLKTYRVEMEGEELALYLEG